MEQGTEVPKKYPSGEKEKFKAIRTAELKVVSTTIPVSGVVAGDARQNLLMNPCGSSECRPPNMQPIKSLKGSSTSNNIVANINNSNLDIRKKLESTSVASLEALFSSLLMIPNNSTLLACIFGISNREFPFPSETIYSNLPNFSYSLISPTSSKPLNSPSLSNLTGTSSVDEKFVLNVHNHSLRVRMLVTRPYCSKCHEQKGAGTRTLVTFQDY